MSDVVTDASINAGEPERFLLRFSHNVIEHLGLKLYQNKPTNVLAELVSNSWDADSEHVWIHLHTTVTGAPNSIIVFDDGCGMDEGNLRNNYLIVGKAKRVASLATERSAIKSRAFMGRKGIGKLAPFGVAKLVDLLTVKHGLVTWLRFNYDDMIGTEVDAGTFSIYEPMVLAKNASIDQVDVSPAEGDAASVKAFFANIAANKTGTMVRASRLTVRRPITADALMESLGRRFTVTLARPDFVVSVNGVPLEERHAFPAWELRIPPTGFETTTFWVPGPSGGAKIERTIKWWAAFVGSATWTQEEAGIGVYAHGKIAQDRPFFFGMRGNEIFSRYLYAVVEADWVDELTYDAISTDRTSIDWDEAEFADFYSMGNSLVKGWIRAYEAHRKSVESVENKVIVDKVLAGDTTLTLRESEKEHLVALLADVTPRLGKEAENREKLVQAAVRAWNHEPARQLIKKLWEEASEFDADKFALVLSKLTDQLVPESLSLAVVFAQRVYALSQLEQHIMMGKETQLQALIEQFPWILDSTYERFLPRRALKTICDQAEAAGHFPTRPVHSSPIADNTKPDFVFLGATVTGTKDHIVVVELKGPSDTAGWVEYEQLNSYVSYLKSRFATTTVEGVLVARSHDKGVIENAGRTIYFKEWNELLLRSRGEHMELIAALLAGSDAHASDSRVQQICALGGEAVTGFLSRMAERDPALRDLVGQLNAKNPAPTSPPVAMVRAPVPPSVYDSANHPAGLAAAEPHPLVVEAVVPPLTK